MRAGLKLSKAEVPDYQIAMLVNALDDDGSGSVGIDELSDFVQRGTRTFNAGPDDGEADNEIVDSWDAPVQKVRNPAPCAAALYRRRSNCTDHLCPLPDIPPRAPPLAKQQKREGFQNQTEEKEKDD